MKGYFTDNGYMGYVDGGYVLFASESDYREYTEDCVTCKTRCNPSRSGLRP